MGIINTGNINKLFPVMLIILDFGASAVYFLTGDIKKGVYWMSAGILTITVTF